MIRKSALIVYLIISFGWTWGCWISAYRWSRSTDHFLRTDMTIFHLAGNFSIVQLLFALGVFGPLLGFLAVRTREGVILFRRPGRADIRFALSIPIVIAIPMFVLSILLSSLADATWQAVALSVIGYFISNVLTSGTEEFGWRGYLYPYLKTREQDFWHAAWKGGFIWALWHYPLLFILYVDAGLAVLVPSLIGFTASIVAMNYITNFIFERSGSILLVMVLHALNNTVSFTLISLYPETPFTIVSSLMAWAVVGYLEKTWTTCGWPRTSE